MNIPLVLTASNSASILLYSLQVDESIGIVICFYQKSYSGREGKNLNELVLIFGDNC
jgi:hypothetical protein